MKYKELHTTLKDGVQFELTQPLRFYFSYPPECIKWIPSEAEGKDLKELENGCLYLEVPSGFKTDFGTIPLLFQSLISPVGKPTKSFVIHDYLCFLAHKGILKRKQADEVFRECMRIQGVGAFKRAVIYSAVRFFALVKGLK